MMEPCRGLEHHLFPDVPKEYVGEGVRKREYVCKRCGVIKEVQFEEIGVMNKEGQFELKLVWSHTAWFTIVKEDG